MFKVLKMYGGGFVNRRCFTTSSMSASECFTTLGIPYGSDEEKIKQAFRKLAKTHHPDLGGTTDKFVKIQQAYENLMDPSFRKTSSASSKAGPSSSSSSSQYWRSWDTSNTWWGGGSTSYSTDQDFDAEFEEQWRKFTREAKKNRGKKFKAKGGSNSMHDEDAFDDSGKSRKENYDSERSSERDRETRRGRKSKQTQADPPDLPERFKLASVDKASGCLLGEYTRISNFNGRVCFKGNAKFVFWSNKNKDWKISEVLKDDGSCLAFTTKIHPSIECPFILGDSSRWMVWSDRARRYIPCKVQAEAFEDDFSSWTVDRLRDCLSSMGLGDKVQRCFEKHELIELMHQFSHLRKQSKDRKKKVSANDPIPPGCFRLCSRQRHDGVVQSPPVLSDTCKTGKNRVEAFMGPLSDIEEWLMRNGDRRRLYGVFDSDRNYCFNLIWKNNKQWARAGAHDW